MWGEGPLPRWTMPVAAAHASEPMPDASVGAGSTRGVGVWPLGRPTLVSVRGTVGKNVLNREPRASSKLDARGGRRAEPPGGTHAQVLRLLGSHDHHRSPPCARGRAGRTPGPCHGAVGFHPPWGQCPGPWSDRGPDPDQDPGPSTPAGADSAAQEGVRATGGEGAAPRPGSDQAYRGQAQEGPLIHTHGAASTDLHATQPVAPNQPLPDGLVRCSGHGTARDHHLRPKRCSCELRMTMALPWVRCPQRATTLDQPSTGSTSQIRRAAASAA